MVNLKAVTELRLSDDSNMSISISPVLYLNDKTLQFCKILQSFLKLETHLAKVSTSALLRLS